MHIFRFDDNKIAELWDFGQAVPTDIINDNGMLLPESKSAEESVICSTQELVARNTQPCFKNTVFFGF